MVSEKCACRPALLKLRLAQSASTCCHSASIRISGLCQYTVCDCEQLRDNFLITAAEQAARASMADPPDSAGVFPCQEGSRINFEWGLGRGLLLAEASSPGAPADTDNGFGAARWYGKVQLPLQPLCILIRTVIQGRAFASTAAVSI